MTVPQPPFILTPILASRMPEPALALSHDGPTPDQAARAILMSWDCDGVAVSDSHRRVRGVYRRDPAAAHALCIDYADPDCEMAGTRGAIEYRAHKIAGAAAARQMDLGFPVSPLSRRFGVDLTTLLVVACAPVLLLTPDARAAGYVTGALAATALAAGLLAASARWYQRRIRGFTMEILDDAHRARVIKDKAWLDRLATLAGRRSGPRPGRLDLRDALDPFVIPIHPHGTPRHYDVRDDQRVVFKPPYHGLKPTHGWPSVTAHRGRAGRRRRLSR